MISSFRSILIWMYRNEQHACFSDCKLTTLFYIISILSYVFKFSGKWFIQKDIRPIVYFWCDKLISWHDCQKTCNHVRILVIMAIYYKIILTKVIICCCLYWTYDISSWRFNCNVHAYASTTGINSSHFLKNQIIWHLF